MLWKIFFFLISKKKKQKKKENRITLNFDYLFQFRRQVNERVRIHRLIFHLLEEAAFCALHWNSDGISEMSKI